MRHSYVLLAAAVCWGLTSCGGGDLSPKATVKAFLDASKKGDEKTAFTYVEKSDLEFMEEMKKEGSGKSNFNPPKDMTFTLGEEKITGDTATVSVKGVKEGKEETQEIKLVRQDGKWKIDLIPEEMKKMLEGMKEMMKGMGEAMKKGLEEAGKEGAPKEEQNK